MSNFFTHPSAVVEEDVKIGDGTSVWHHAHIRTGAQIGKDCVVGKNVYVDMGVPVGDRCKLQNNVSVFAGVKLGDDVFVGPSATFTNDLTPRAFNTSWTITETTVEHGASIGANATIVCGVTIGSYAMIAAGATVTSDVAAHELVGGTPARTMGWVCFCGAVISRGRSTPLEMFCQSCQKGKK